MKILTKGKYYGVQKSEMKCNGILLSQYNYNTSKTDWHYHENPYFMYVLQGNMIDGNAKTKTLCPSGSLMFNNWQESHYGCKASEKASGFHLELERKWFDHKAIDVTILEGSKLIENPKVHFLFAKLYYEFMYTDEYSEVSIELLIIQICETLEGLKENDKKDVPKWVERLKELLHYDTTPISLKYLSDQLDVHPVHISRAAPKYLSASIGQYTREQKLKKAIPYILYSKLSLTEIAYLAGFSDQSHFNRVFRLHFNMNPSIYRNRILNKQAMLS